MYFFKKYLRNYKNEDLSGQHQVKNPILDVQPNNDLKIIKEYLQLHKITLDELLQWSCPICLESFDNPGVFMTIPFKCNHLVCFSCLKSWCQELRPRYQDDVINKIKCCLCRQPVNNFWFDSYHTYTLSDKYQDKIIKLVFPSSLDHRYPSRVHY